MHEKEFHLLPNFPKGIEEIVKAVAEELKKGEPMHGEFKDPIENAAVKVIRRIEDRVVPENYGLSAAPGKPTGKFTAGENIEAFDWAKRRYFMLLLIDECRGGVRDHGICKPDLDQLGFGN
jgi:hypothetical protein